MTKFELMSYELAGLIIIIRAISAIFIGIALIYTAKQIKLLIKIHADNHDWNRRIATQQALTELKKLSKDDLNREFRYLAHPQPLALDKILSAFENDSTLGKIS